MAPTIGDRVVYDGHADARPLAFALGGEEGLEHSRFGRLVHATAALGDRQVAASPAKQEEFPLAAAEHVKERRPYPVIVRAPGIASRCGVDAEHRGPCGAGLPLIAAEQLFCRAGIRGSQQLLQDRPDPLGAEQGQHARGDLGTDRLEKQLIF